MPSGFELVVKSISKVEKRLMLASRTKGSSSLGPQLPYYSKRLIQFPEPASFAQTTLYVPSYSIWS